MKYPIYIVSKGRASSQYTFNSLKEMNLKPFVVVENQEYYEYLKYIPIDCLLILDRKFQDEYETCDNFGLEKSLGPGPARNFAWEHSISNGYKFHWVMDDNINRGFFRFNHNLKTPCKTSKIFSIMEEFTERFNNVVMSGPNYFMFVSRKSVHPAFVTNTRIYSCNFIKNDLDIRWRGRYNEDTDLSIRILKKGLCTILFNAFLQGKMETQKCKGGNTEEFYKNEGTKSKSEMIVNLHPDVAKLVFKFGRWHHEVDYSMFKRNQLKRKPGLQIDEGINNYGMVLQQNFDGEWREVKRPIFNNQKHYKN